MIKIKRPKTKSFETETAYLKKLKRSVSNIKYYQKTHKPTAETKVSLQLLNKEIKAAERKLTPKITKEVVKNLEKQGVLTAKTSAKALELKGKERLRYVESKYKKLTKAVEKERLKQALVQSKSLGTPLKKPSKVKNLAEISYGVLKGSGSTTYIKGAKAIKTQTSRYVRSIGGYYRKKIYINNVISSAKKHKVDTNSPSFVKFIEAMKDLSPLELAVAIGEGSIPHLDDIYTSEKFIEGKAPQKSLEQRLEDFQHRLGDIKDTAREIEEEINKNSKN